LLLRISVQMRTWEVNVRAKTPTTRRNVNTPTCKSPEY
jgi:hypothetical protein